MYLRGDKMNNIKITDMLLYL